MFKERIQKTARCGTSGSSGASRGQSFHEQQAASGYFANPLTMAVTSLQLPSTTVMFDEASSTLTATGTAALDRFARIVNKRRARGAQIGSINVKGWATGSGLGLTAKSLAKKRARAAAAYLEAVGVDPALLRVETGASGEWGAGGPAGAWRSRPPPDPPKAEGDAQTDRHPPLVRAPS
jgi:outer membrane protein OmpA-like peptidoglycan-associated protein